MKKNFLMTLVLALLCITTGWAQFAPVEGKMYALKEKTTGLYLDIQTLGVNEEGQSGTNNISLNVKPCVIYFAKGTTDNTKWTMMNVNGTYAMQATTERNWNATIGTTAEEWTIAEVGDTDLFTIARSDGGFIDGNSKTNGAPLYCDKGTGMQLALVEYDNILKGSYTLMSPDNTYMSGCESATGLLADGVYTIQGDANGQRGYMAAGEGYAAYPILSDIVLSGYTGNSVTAIENGKNWYVSTKTEGTYIYNLGISKYLVKENDVINFSDTPFAWTIKQNGNYTSIYDSALGKYLSMGCGRSAANRPIAWDTNASDGGSLHTFTAVANGTTTFATQIEAIEAAFSAMYTFQSTPANFYVVPSAGTWFIESTETPGNYIGSTHTWNVTSDFSLWNILDADVDGFAAIVRASDNNQHLGSDEDEASVGTGIFTNVGENCNAWYFTGTYNVPTAATNVNNKYSFTSDYIVYAGACNKIRFTLTESAAFYKNGANRMSFDSFAIYDASGNAVKLTSSNVTGNNIADFTNMLDGTDGTYTNATWDSSSATNDWFEITIDKDVDLKGAFKFSFLTENTTMNAKAFEIVTRYEKPADYTFAIDAPADKDYSVTYDGNAIAAGDKIVITTFDEDLMVATEIEGYTWSVVVDDENETITLVYTEAPDEVNPASVVALINRIGGEGTDAKFKFVLSPSMNSKNEEFVISSEEGKILIKGTTISAITTGIGWYLQHYAKINIAWNSLNEKTVSGAAYADLSNLPVPTGEETRTSDAMYRYYLNTCAFGYSMTSWTWKRWQQEIDWMALHGINMPLQLVGLEEVWRTFLTMEDGNGSRKYNYTDEQAKAFVAGPAFIAWWAMNNLQGWGGTAEGTKSGGTWEGAGGVQDDAWYARQKKLAKQIVDRQRELGMQPVLPGWSGMVPSNFAAVSGYATRNNGGNWAGDFVRPLLLSVSNANYQEIAADYYTCLQEVMGESQYYSMDPFHESGGVGTMEDYEAMYEAMETATPGSKWVIQQWQWSASQKYSLTAVPAGRLVVLDLFSDGSPAFDNYNGYAPQDAVFCAIPNFGGRSGIMARLNNLANNYFLYKGKYASIKGIGAAPEAIEQTPVTYDLIFQLPWMGAKPDVAEWVKNYSIARYGVENKEAQEAWELLRQGPLNYGADGIQGPIEDVWAARPNLDANKASSWGKTLANAQGTYTKARQTMLIDATFKLLDQSESLGFTAGDGSVYESNYYYDLVEFGGGVLADYAYYLLLSIKEAKNAGNTALYEARRDTFLQLILDVDRFKGTNLNFRLGKWTQEARAAAAEVENAETATADWYEYNNARTIVSTWSSPNTNLTDYSYRSWQGLLKDLYYPRWKHYFDHDCTSAEYGYFEWNWAHGRVHSVGQTAVSNEMLAEGVQGHTDTYTRDPEGNTVEVAKEVLNKYIITVVANGKRSYAYRCLTNDMTTSCTVIAEAGTTVDLSPYFGELENVSITGDFINGTATDIKNVAIKADATDGSHTGTITLTDGTVLTFAVVINPAYNGVYKIDYQNNGDVPVFVGYCTEYESGSVDGYKLIATGTYNPVVEADKLFTIAPQGTGYYFMAQGQYMKAPNLGGWDHIAFSENSTEAGAYLFEETGTDTGIFKIRSTGSGINYLNDYNNLVFGNDNSAKENLSTFKFTKVTEYTVNVPAEGFTTLYLPFNVVLPEGVTAYTIAAKDIKEDGEGGYVYMSLTQVAAEGEKLYKGTPVIIKASAGNYTFGVTVDDADAKKATAPAMCGTYFAKDGVNSDANVKRYSVALVDGDFVFNQITSETNISSNSCWLETSADDAQITKYVFKSAEIEDGAVFRIRGVMSDGTTRRTLYTDGQNTIKWTADASKLDASTLFVAQKQGDTDSYKLVSALANGIWGYEANLTEEGTALYFTEGSQQGTYTIYAKDNTNSRTFSVENNGALGYYTKNNQLTEIVNETVTTDFELEKVDASEVSYARTISSDYAYATLFLPFNVEVPAGISAYTANDELDQSGSKPCVVLSEVTTIIPANTAVILYRDDKSADAEFVFNYTTNAAAEVVSNIFDGRLITSAVGGDANMRYYLLLKRQHGEAFYWMKKEYNASLGSGDAYIKCEANKAFLTIDPTVFTNGASSTISFRFDGATGVEEITGENETVDAVYDLQGRKLTEITGSGVYIMNGKKVLVK